MNFFFLRLLACFLFVPSLSVARADVFIDGDHVMLQFSPRIVHFNYNPNHNNLPWLVGAEWESASRWEVGVAYFKNSFYQPSEYVYVGKRWFLESINENLYVKLTGGPLYGYKGQYEDKVPFNRNGLAVAIVPAIGYQYGRANAQIVIFGTAGLMFTFGYDVWK